MYRDPVVEEIRRIREEYGGRFDYDIDALYADLKRQEQESGREYVSFEPRRIKRSDGGRSTKAT